MLKSITKLFTIKGRIYKNKNSQGVPFKVIKPVTHIRKIFYVNFVMNDFNNYTFDLNFHCTTLYKYTF